MTYCLAATVEDGLVFVSDSRTNTGIDQLGEYGRPRPGKVVTVVTAPAHGQQTPLAVPVRECTQAPRGMRSWQWASVSRNAFWPSVSSLPGQKRAKASSSKYSKQNER